MDLNIGAALWLAARAHGRLRVFQNQAEVVPAAMGNLYRSEARIVLVGHGADEQCAGYSRHRTKFRHKACFYHTMFQLQFC